MQGAISKVFEGKERLIILGLTGRTGSGCSTVAKILSNNSIDSLDIKSTKEHDYRNSEERKENIIYKYIKENNRWVPFDVIDISSLILACAFESGYDELCNYIHDITNETQKGSVSISEKEKFIVALNNAEHMYEDCRKFSLNPSSFSIEKTDYKTIEEYYKFYMNEIKKYKKNFRESVDKYTCYEVFEDKFKGKQQSKYHLYTYLLQKIGNNIRCSGNPFSDKFDENNRKAFVDRIINLIKIIIKYDEQKGKKSTRICIDAIRNPYEAIFLKDKYRSFYLMAINTEDSDRRSRLNNLTQEEFDNLDSVEYAAKMEKPQEVFYHQSISSCLEYAGIHIYNPNIKNGKYYELTFQILKYISLILHPGLVTPTHIERCMQLAYNTKFNSGCLSRQVGAIVTREDFSVQSVGWNDVPKGQIPCLLRDAKSFCQNKDKESYSKFELEDKNFFEAINKIDKETKDKLSGRCMPYCFKDVYNSLTNQKNQVYTRALHAEENAFLQISKYGGTHVKNGKLFTTASPCELCAKKAYQLGIKDIYYINPYPGISKNHILTFGKDNNPKMNLFYGAIGQSYIDFYEPRIATKDELELLTDINVKELVLDDKNKDYIEFNDIVYTNIELHLRFIGGKNEIESTRKIEAIINKDNFKEFPHKIIWTGTSYEGTELIKEQRDDDVKITESKDELPYCYSLIANRNKGEKLKYAVLTRATDDTNIMEPYFAHMVKHKTNKLRIVLEHSNDDNILGEVYIKKYADLKMETEVFSKKLEKKNKKGLVYYEFQEKDAVVNYTYSIEWKFEDQT